MKRTNKIFLLLTGLFFFANGSCMGGNAVVGSSSATTNPGTAKTLSTPAATSSALSSPTPPNAPAGAGQHTLNFVNQCSQTVWVGALPNGPTFALPENGGWELAPGNSHSITLAGNWGGRFWGRTGCSSASGTFKCDTGDCGGLTCEGRGGQPTSLAEFLLSDASGKDFYDISLVDAFNLPMSIAPDATTFAAGTASGQLCGSPTCSTNINTLCPSQLQLKDATGQTVACLSACIAENTDAACCRNAYNSSAACPPTALSEVFKSACPNAYSYAYDDQTSTYTCTATAYTVTFCPTAASGGGSTTKGTP